MLLSKGDVAKRSSTWQSLDERKMQKKRKGCKNTPAYHVLKERSHGNMENEETQATKIDVRSFKCIKMWNEGMCFCNDMVTRRIGIL